MRVHLDTDFLVHALSRRGPERTRLLALSESPAEIEISAIAWYEFTRGPRSPGQLAVARDIVGPDGVLPFTEDLAVAAGEVFRSLGSPRRRAADIAIGITAAARGALLLTRNGRDFSGVPGLRVEERA